MKRFLFKIFLFSIFIFSLHFSSLFVINGKGGDAYLKLSSGKKESLIIGTSRASQAISPSEFDTILPEFSDLYNFAFSISHSPFGKTYYDAILNKLDTTSNNKKLFIICVDPWALRGDRFCSSKDSCFVEKKLFLGKIKNTHSNPNLEYLIKSYKYGWGKLIIDQINSPLFIDERGWLKVDISMDSSSYNMRLNMMLNQYREKASIYIESSNRYKYLSKIISLLKNYGEVVLVRLPVNERLKLIEECISPNFELRMISLAKSYKIPFISYWGNCNDYDYSDGNHLYWKSSQLLSRDLASKISNNFTSSL